MAKPQRVTFLRANLKDQSGTLLSIMKDLKAKKIALKCLWGYGKSEGTADLFAIAKDSDKLRDTWKATGVFAEEGIGFFIKGDDKTGVLLKSLEVLAQANVNIKASITIAVSGKFGSIIWVDTMDVEKAAQALGAK